MLNKTPIPENLPEQLRRVKKNSKGENELNVSTKYFEYLSSIIEKSDLIGRKKPKSMTEITKRTRKEVTNSNIVPIGILNADVTLLTNAQIKENLDAKSKGKNADNSKYENLEIMAAGLLQEAVFQGNVSFQISKDLIHSNKTNPIDHIEINFNDNKGWRSFELKEQLIKHQFNSTGGQTIAIKIVTKRASYIAYCPIKIALLTRPQPMLVGKVSAEKIKREEGIKGGKVANTVAGAEFIIYPSCDNIFDKPIIIAEGFDEGQNRDINDLLDKYYDVLVEFRRRGFDLVLVNYDDGRDYIENNAQALMRVIQQVNSLKQGNQKSMVIGESMSGLVARFAIRQMEQQGQTHNVGHFVSFDSPQRGANIPVGLIRTRQFSQTIFAPWLGLFDELNNLLDFIPALSSMDTPAARQMLLTYQQQNGPHPEFNILQNTLNNMGYPSQDGIRNIAVLNGSLDQTFQQFGFNDQNDIQPGNRILKARYPLYPFFLNIDVWTNNIAQNTQVFEGQSTITFPPFAASDYNSFRNLDRLPGGYIDYGFFGLDISSRFSFVPTFSSIDFRGTLNDDAQHNIQIAGNIINGNFQVINPNLTPFNAIYGNTFPAIRNTYHAIPISEVFEKLRLQEFPNQPTLIRNAPNTCNGGNFYGFVDNINCNYINGWVFDNDNLNRTVNAQIFVDGQYFATVTANENRFDLAGPYGNAAIPHGFTYQIPVNAPWKDGQPHTILVKPCGQSFGPFVATTVTLTCTGNPPQVGCTNGNFNGHLDQYNCDNISGWVFDFNDLNRTVNADVYIDGTFFGTVAANENRGDLGAAFNNPAAIPHGFTFNVPANAAWKDGQQHSVSVKPCGGSDFIANSGQTLTCQGGGGGGTPPGSCGAGNYNGHTDIINCDEVSGWTFDFNDLNKTVIAQIYVDGNLVGSTDANLNRYDLGAAFNNPAAVPHGFTYFIPSNAPWKDGQMHLITVKPCGGQNSLPNQSSIACGGGNNRISLEQKQEISSEEVSKETKVLPNPTSGKATILYFAESEGKIVIEISDTKGSKLKTSEHEGKQGQNKLGIDLSNYPSGIYLLNISTQQKQESLKVFKD